MFSSMVYSVGSAPGTPGSERFQYTGLNMYRLQQCISKSAKAVSQLSVISEFNRYTAVGTHLIISLISLYSRTHVNNMNNLRCIFEGPFWKYDDLDELRFVSWQIELYSNICANIQTIANTSGHSEILKSRLFTSFLH